MSVIVNISKNFKDAITLWRHRNVIRRRVVLFWCQWKNETHSYTLVANIRVHREIMPLRITVAYDTLCRGGIFQSGESRMNGPLYTVAIEISNTLCQMIWSSTTLRNVSFVTLLHVEGTCSAGPFAMLSRPLFDFHLLQCTKACSFSSRHGGRCHCGHEVPHAIYIQSDIFSLVYRAFNIENTGRATTPPPSEDVFVSLGRGFNSQE